MHIYKITNIVNGKVYVGQTIQKNPKMRWYEHCACARSGKKSYLYDSIRKYGVENFCWEIIDQAGTIEELNAKEGQWVDYYRNLGIVVYNNREAGGNKTHSPESIERMRRSQQQAHARRRENNNGVERHSKPRVHKGKTGLWTRSDGGSMKGKTMSLTTKEKIRQVQIERSGTRGKTWTLVNGKRVYTEKNQ